MKLFSTCFRNEHFVSRGPAEPSRALLKPCGALRSPSEEPLGSPPDFFKIPASAEPFDRLKPGAIGLLAGMEILALGTSVMCCGLVTA